MTTYIKGTNLDFSDLWNHFGMTRDKGGRWEASLNTQEWVKEYLSNYRTPSRAWPLSHAKAMLSQKFAKAVCENEPNLAVELGIAE